MSDKKHEQEKKAKEQKSAENAESKEQKAPLTEWQQRNLEFLAQKKQEKEAKEQQKKEERLEKLARYGKVPKEEEEQEEAAKQESDKDKPKKKTKKTKVKKVKEKKELTKRQKALIKALPVLIVSVLLIAISLFMISPYSKEKTVTVKGSAHTASETVIKEANIKSSDYIFSLLLHPKRYETRLKAANPWVSSAKLRYQFPNHFTLTVKEYSVVGYVQTDAGYQPLLSSGETASVVAVTDLPATYITITLTDKTMLKELAKDLMALDKTLRDSIETIALAGSSSTSDLLTLTMRDGNTVRVPLSEMTTKLPYYSKIKDKLTAPAIVDMEVGIYTTTADIEANNTATTAEATAESSETTTENSEAAAETQQTESAESTTAENQEDSTSQTETAQTTEGQ